MTYDEAVQRFNGSARQMAEALGVSVPAVQYWKSTGAIPKVRQFQIETITNDKV